MKRKTINGKVLLMHAGIALLCIIISFNVFLFQNMPVINILIQIVLTVIVLLLYGGFFYLDFFNKGKVDVVNQEFDATYPLRCNSLYVVVTMAIVILDIMTPIKITNYWMSPYVFIYGWVGQNIFVKVISVFIMPTLCWLGYRTASTNTNLFHKISDKIFYLIYKK